VIAVPQLLEQPLMTAMSQMSNLLCHEMTMHLSHEFLQSSSGRKLNSKGRILHFLAGIYDLSDFTSSDPIYTIYIRAGAGTG
jgi:hypothetical protein